MKNNNLTDEKILEALSKSQKSILEISNALNILPNELKKYLSKKQKTQFILFIDGGARGNPGESGIGIVSEYNKQKNGYYYYTGHSTNNEAEYNALIMGLKISIKNGHSEVKIYSDSELICNQINGIYKIKNESLLKLYKISINLINKLKKFSISHIPRNENREADKMANIAIDLKKNGKIELAVASIP